MTTKPLRLWWGDIAPQHSPVLITHRPSDPLPDRAVSCRKRLEVSGFLVKLGESTQQMLVQNSKVLQNINEIGATLAILSDTGRAGAALALNY